MWHVTRWVNVAVVAVVDFCGINDLFARVAVVFPVTQWFMLHLLLVTMVDVAVVAVVNDCSIDDQLDRLADVLPLARLVDVVFGAGDTLAVVH